MTTTLPFLDVRAAYLELRSEIDGAVARVLDSGHYIGGPEVEAFEREWADYCGVRHCVGVGNGLDALTLSLRVMNVGPGDEVIVPAHTFIATWLAVSQVGAIPVPVDIDPLSFNLDVAQVERAITGRTKVLLPVHLYGRPAELEPLLALAARHGLRVLDDAAQAHGARYRGRRIGGRTNASTWSFYPGKNLGALGDAGAVTTDDDDLAAALRRLRNYGSTQKYHHQEQGVNSRLDPLQAAILRVKLGRLDEWNSRRRALADHYVRALPAYLRPNEPEAGTESSWHLFVVRVPDREARLDHLVKRGIQALIHYPLPPYLQPAYASLGLQAAAFPVATQASAEVLSLPFGPHLPPAAVATVCSALTSPLDGA